MAKKPKSKAEIEAEKFVDECVKIAHHDNVLFRGCIWEMLTTRAEWYRKFPTKPDDGSPEAKEIERYELVWDRRLDWIIAMFRPLDLIDRQCMTFLDCRAIELLVAQAIAERLPMPAIMLAFLPEMAAALLMPKTKCRGVKLDDAAALRGRDLGARLMIRLNEIEKRYLDKPFTAEDELRELSGAIEVALAWCYDHDLRVDQRAIAQHIHDAYNAAKAIRGPRGPIRPAEDDMGVNLARRRLEELHSFPQSETPANVPILHPDDVKILDALAQAGTTLTQESLESRVGFSIGTIKTRLKTLRGAGLVHRPNGTKGGNSITDAGRAAITKIEENRS